jgi:hypothetical protein
MMHLLKIKDIFSYFDSNESQHKCKEWYDPKNEIDHFFYGF